VSFNCVHSAKLSCSFSFVQIADKLRLPSNAILKTSSNSYKLLPNPSVSALDRSKTREFPFPFSLDSGAETERRLLCFTVVELKSLRAAQPFSESDQLPYESSIELQDISNFCKPILSHFDKENSCNAS